MRRRLAPLLALAAFLLALAVPAAAGADVVLGARGFAAPNGSGWGTAEPREIFNGGDPSGSVRGIRWSGWGDPTALGRGQNPIFKPGGGYYRRPGRIVLRATALGHCGAARAYTRLEFRVAKKPGAAPTGPWRLWSGARSICKSPF